MITLTVSPSPGSAWGHKAAFPYAHPNHPDNYNDATRHETPTRARPEINKSQRNVHKTKQNGGIRKAGGGRATRASTKRFRELLDSRSEANAESRLLSLPGEVRNRIFEFASGGNEIWHVLGLPQFRLWPWKPFNGYARFMGAPWEELFSLGRACRQLHSETHLLPIRFNIFAIDNGNKEDKPLRGVKTIFTQNITAIFLKRGLFDYSPSAYRIPAELPELLSLRTIIRWRQEDHNYIETVTKFAEERGTQLLAEGNPRLSSSPSW